MSGNATAPGIVDETVRRLTAEFTGRFEPATVLEVVGRCHNDLSGVPSAALPELVERLARQHLIDLRRMVPPTDHDATRTAVSRSAGRTGTTAALAVTAEAGDPPPAGEGDAATSEPSVQRGRWYGRHRFPPGWLVEGDGHDLT